MDDFSLKVTGLTGTSISSLSGSGKNYTVIVSTGSGQGTIQLVLTDNDSITNGSGTPLGGTGAGNGSFNGETYTIDRSGATVNLTSTASNPTDAPIPITATFSEPVSGLTAASILVSGGTITDFGGYGTTWNWTITPSAQGTVTCQVPAGVAVDAAGNLNQASNILSRIFNPSFRLSVGSSGISGVSITVTPADRNGLGNGITSFNRDYFKDTAVGLTAPAQIGAYLFQKWQRDGADFTGNTNLNVITTMNSDHAMMAFYHLDSDATPPTFKSIAVSPGKVKLGSKATISFTASEVLMSSPTLTVNTHAAAIQTHTGLTYGFSYTIAANDPDGMATITIVGMDRAGNTGTATNTTLLRVDKTVPVISGVTATPGTAKTNAAVGVSFTVSESLSSSPTLKINNNPATLVSHVGFNYGFSYIIAANEPDGPATILIVGTDLAGNTAMVTNTTALQVDNPADRPKANFTGDVFVVKTDGTMHLSISLSKTSTQQVSVDYATTSENGTALPGVDYVATNGTLNFSPGTTIQTLSINILNNAQLTGPRTFMAKITGATHALAGEKDQARVTILKTALSGVVSYLLGLTSNPAGLDLNSDGTICISDEIYRMEGLKPAAPSSPTPADKTTGVATNPAFSWSDCSYATSYDLYIWRASVSRPATPIVSGLTTNNYTLTTPLQTGTAYLWQVIANKPMGNQTGPAWAFTTKY